MDPGLVRLTCVFQSKLGGGSYMYMIRMHAHRCDTSNDISICNLKEFECIQECNNNSDISKVFKKSGIQDSRFKNVKKYFWESLNLESQNF